MARASWLHGPVSSHHAAPQGQKGPVLGLMPRCCHLEVFNHFKQGAPHFSFTMAFTNYTAHPVGRNVLGEFGTFHMKLFTLSTNKSQTHTRPKF